MTDVVESENRVREAPHPRSPHHRASGQFARGNKAAVGHVPGQARTLALVRLLDEAIDPERWLRIIRALASRAEKGDVRAAEELLDRRFGRAPSAIESGTYQSGGGLRIVIQRPDWEPPKLQAPPRALPPA